ncbi:MAG: DUF1684 domain-containing protein, partial [Pseudomonadota bacterium]
MTPEREREHEHEREQLIAEIDAHRESRQRRLTSPSGWLSIIAKVWLSEGEHDVGSRSGAAIPLPAGAAPPLLGRVTVSQGVVHFAAAPGVTVFADGRPIESLILRSDVEESPTTLTSGTLSVQLLRRGDEVAIRVRDAASPALAAFAGIPSYPVDPAWRVVARLERFAPPNRNAHTGGPSHDRAVVYQDTDGRPQPYLSPGVAVFDKDGVTCRLELVYEGDRRRLFLLFRDASNADETYGGGRFLYVPIPEDEGAAGDDSVVLD